MNEMFLEVVKIHKKLVLLFNENLTKYLVTNLVSNQVSASSAEMTVKRIIKPRFC